MTAKEKATALHGQGYNCAQAVLMAMGGVGGGAGCRELCGALSGAIMAVGMKVGAENRAQVNAADREIVTAFREKFGAVRCADLKAAKISCDDVIAFAAEKAEELLK